MPAEINKFQQSAAKSYGVSPRLVARADAAHYAGIGPTLFDGLVSEGVFPPPKIIHKRRLWDLRELDKAIDQLPDAEVKANNRESTDPYDDVHA